MNAFKKNLNLNNVPESLIRQARAASAGEGKPLYAWAIEAFQEKLEFDQIRDPGRVTERLVNAIQALGSSKQEADRLETAFTCIAPLLKTDFPAHVQGEFANLMETWQRGTSEKAGWASEALLSILLKIWGPSWYR